MRRTLSITALVAVLGGAAFIVAPSASAQYPPPLCEVTTGTQFAGDHAIGTTFTAVLSPACVFTPGASVDVTVNGVAVTPPPKIADASGSVSVTVFVESATSLLIDDPVQVPGRCGSNTIVATGPSQVAQAIVTQSATFNVLCPGAVPRAVQGRVAFTGANVAILVAVAVALVGIGAALVIANRRRRSQPGT